MGRGIAYPHPHHIIVDYYGLTPDPDDEQYNDEHGFDEDEHDDDCKFIWDDFKEQVAIAFDAWDITPKSDGREKYLFAETDRLYIGVDTGGEYGSPCIYLKPKVWERPYHQYGYRYYEEIEYNINADAKKGFNRLIKQYGNLIGYWTTAYTSGHYGKQKDGSYVSYGRKQ